MNWLRITSARSGVYAIEEPGHVAFYLVNGRSRTALIDTGMGFTSLRRDLRSLLRPNVVVLNTHWHYDHVGGNHEFAQIGISGVEADLLNLDLPNSLLQAICIEPALADSTPLPDDFDPASYHIRGTRPSFIIAEGDKIDLGGRTLEAIATPGHSRGSLSFFDSQTGDLFLGDLAYRSDIYWQFAESDLDEAIGSLQKLLARQSDFRRLWPCHGPYPLPPSFLQTALDAAQTVGDGAPPAAIINAFGDRCRVHQFVGFQIWTKLPSEPGADLVKLFSTHTERNI